jgi:proteasome accessory factor B
MSSAKTERLINLTMALLASRRFMPKSEIFRRVAGYEGSNDTKERMFERDKDELRSLGIEIEVASYDPLFEDEVGYRISPEEFQLKSIFTGRDLGLMATAIGLINGASNETNYGNLLQRINSFSVTPLNPDSLTLISAPEIERRLIELTKAMSTRSMIRFEYQKADGDVPRLRQVNPMGLSAWRSEWYLVGEDLDRGDIRVFRVNRIISDISIDRKRETFDIPSDFKVSEYLIMLRKRMYRATVLIKPECGDSLLIRFAENEDSTDRSTNDRDDWREKHLLFSDIEEATSNLARFGSDVVVVEPAELKDALKAVFKKIEESHV